MKRTFRRLISLLLIVQLLVTSSITVYADEDGRYDNNAEQGDGQGLSNVTNGRKLWGLTRQGYSVYVVDKQGNIIQTVWNFWYEQPEGGDDLFNPTIGAGTAKETLLPAFLSDMPPALVNRGGAYGVPNGDALREWINAESKISGIGNGEYLIFKILGKDKLELFQQDKCKLVIEALFWHYPNNIQGSREAPIAGTIKNIANWTLSNPDYSTDFNGNHSPYGDYWVYTYIQNNAPHSLQLGYYDEDYKIGIPGSSSGNVYLSEVVDPSQGYGLHIYKIGDFAEKTKTYDEVQTVPAPAPEMEPPIDDSTVRKILRPVEIIKVYETTTIDPFGNKTKTTDAVTYREHNCRNIQIMDEPNVGEGYTVTNWQESVQKTRPQSWESVEATSFVRKSTGSRTITTYPQTKVLYVRLEHVNSEEIEQTELILRESEITRAFETHAVKDWGYTPMLFSWQAFDGVCSADVGCTCNPCECVTEDEDEDGNPIRTGTCDCHDTCGRSYTVADGSYNLLMNVQTSNNKVIPEVSPFKTLKEFGAYHSGAVNQTGAGELTIPDYKAKFVIWRGDDIPTLAQFESTSSEAVKSLTPTGNVPQADRLKASYQKPITLKIQHDTGNPDSDTELKSACPVHSDHSRTVTINADNSIEYNGVAKIQVYSGEEKSLADEIPNASKLKKVSRKDGYIVKSYSTWLNTSDEPLQFYPVVRMSYQLPGSQEHEKNEVFVLSQYLSEMKVAQALRVEWQSNNTNLFYNVNVRSDQWSSDVNATNESIGWKKAGWVLDGGFIYQLSTDERKDNGASGSTITLTGYYPCIRSEQRAKIQGVDPKWTETNGEDEFNRLVESTVDKINAARMDQYLDAYSTRGTQTALNGRQVYPGASLERGQCATDNKYYLRDTDGPNSNHVRGALTANSSSVYDFYSDYKGNIYMNGTVILKQGDGIEKLPDSVKAIDDNTKVVTNLVGAITRNQGQDESNDWCKNGHWYNEQSPVIQVIVYTAKITVDLADHDGQGGAQSVLDPSLCPQSTGTGSKYSDANITQFVINFDNNIGTVFSGQRVNIPNSDNLLVSRYFYVPNVNVQQKD